MIVFHYTDIDNLVEILSLTNRSNQRLVLRAKHRCYLNDDAQRTFGRYILPSCIESIEEDLHIDPQMAVAPLFKQAGYIDSILYGVNTFDDHHQGINSFVLSFSEDQDNVELWEKRGNGGRGIALGFDTDKLFLDHERFVNILKQKCIYWSDEIKQPGFSLAHDTSLYSSILETYKMVSDPRVLDAFKKLYGQNGPTVYVTQQIKDTLVENLITTFDVFNKQDVWRNEKEYRVSLSPLPLNLEFVKDNNGDYIPFTSVPISVEALRMIVIGPKCGKNAYGMVKAVLSNKGISQEVNVINSAIRA